MAGLMSSRRGREWLLLWPARGAVGFRGQRKCPRPKVMIVVVDGGVVVMRAADCVIKDPDRDIDPHVQEAHTRGNQATSGPGETRLARRGPG